MIGTSNEQMLEHLKEIGAQLLGIDNIDIAYSKSKSFLTVVKSELPQPTTYSMLVHITERNDDTKHIEETSKTKPNTLGSSISLQQDQFLLVIQAFASPPDMASSGVVEMLYFQ